jgi:hypothetical protein
MLRAYREGLCISGRFERARLAGRGFNPGKIRAIHPQKNPGSHSQRRNSTRREAGVFNPRIKPAKSMLALATERRFSQISPEIPSLSADTLASEEMYFQ